MIKFHTRILIQIALCVCFSCSTVEQKQSNIEQDSMRISPGEDFIIKVCAGSLSGKKTEADRLEAETAALRRMEKLIGSTSPRWVVERVIGNRIEGASGAADYYSTGIGVAKELMGKVPGGNIVVQDIRTFRPSKSAENRLEKEFLKKYRERQRDILSRHGKFQREYYNDTGQYVIVYRVPAKSFISLIALYNKSYNTSAFDYIVENDFINTGAKPLSTFSIDVDTASYSIVRRFLKNGKLPPAGAVRIEEMINYFSYDYPKPRGRHPVLIHTEMGQCPWDNSHMLVMIALQGRVMDPGSIPPRNLTLLLDVSGSMNCPDKLPLLIRAMELLVKQLNHNDRISIVVYAGAAGVVLQPTRGREKTAILEAFKKLSAGGSTDGGEGIRLAYRLAKQHFRKNGINRIILATDGDFNVGVTSQSELLRIIEEQRKSGIYLTVLGFGMGNLKDSIMEKLADKGNGNYAYIDDYSEAVKVLGSEIGATLITIAKDVKVQVEFNPRKIGSYRLIGYENRKLNDQDFADDTKDAGEMGSGHRVTVLYEVVPADKQKEKPVAQGLRYQKERELSKTAGSEEALFVKLRYKNPGSDASRLITESVPYKKKELNACSANMRFASSVAGFAMLLRNSGYKGSAGFDMVYKLASRSRGADPKGYRAEFLRLVNIARELK